ncbi:MAG: AI-2E family transporter [bacterium]
MPPVILIILIFLSYKLLKAEDRSSLIVIFSSAFALWFIYRLGFLVLHILISVYSAFLLNPFVNRLQRFRIGRFLSVILVFLIIIVSFILSGWWLVPKIVSEIERGIGFFGALSEWGVDKALSFSDWYSELSQRYDLSFITPFIDDIIREIFNAIKTGLLKISSLLLRVPFIFKSIFHLILIPILTFYLLMDYDKLYRWMIDNMPEGKREGAREVFGGIGRIISGYVLGLFMVCVIEGSLLALGLYFIGIPFAILIGYFAGLMNIIPSIGVIIGVIPAIISSLFTEHPLRSLLLVGALYTGVQILDGFVVGPKIMGRKVGLHPILIILAIVVGTHFFGFIGFFVSVPIVAIALFIYRYLRKRGSISDKLDRPDKSRIC